MTPGQQVKGGEALISMPGYVVKERLYEGGHSVVYRGRREEDDRPVVLKMLRHEFPTPYQLARFRREFEITRKLEIDGVIDTYSLEKYKNTLVMVLEDFGGAALSGFMFDWKPELRHFLSIARRIATILGEIHNQGIIHKDINPSNIVWNPDTDQIKIIDFGISTELSRERSELRNPNVMEGTLAYISPEQTGRMNRTIDYRSDLYSLGVSWFEFLTGTRPFRASDSMKLVHYHIAVDPDEVHARNSGVPRQISDIVGKLLRKNAEDRYQSAQGLHYDLDQCLQALEVTGQVGGFPLGQEDYSGRFQILQKLYGRDQEIERLLAAFRRVSRGATELLLVAGTSGVGKTALVHEVHKPITAGHGIFVAGKFDQFQRDVPYLALKQAFAELCSYILSEPEDVLYRWKDDILAAVEREGQVLIDIIPELELVIGKQPAVKELSHREAAIRLGAVFNRFMVSICKKDRPLTIFIDDVQWIDSGSLLLLEGIIVNPELSHFFVIFAYRDNEVGPSHPVKTTVAEIARQKIPILEIGLEPLEETDVTELVADALRCAPEFAAELSQLTHEKTGGNAFFVNQFLRALAGEGLLEYSFQKREWVWDIADITARDATENVVELMARKIEAMDPGTRDSLQLAAALGNKFDLKIMSIITEKAVPHVLHDLWAALDEGLLVALDQNYKWLDTAGKQDTPGEFVQGAEPDLVARFKFIHDRVQEAAYATIPDARREQIHLNIARLLLAFAEQENTESLMFDIIGQYEKGSRLLEDRTEKIHLARLCLLASNRAIQSSAFESAMNIATFAVTELLETASWEEEYELTVNLYRNKAACEFSSVRLEEGEKTVLIAMEKSRTQEHQVVFYKIYSNILFQMNRHHDALKNSRKALEDLGVRLPKKITKRNIAIQYMFFRMRLGLRKPEDLLKLPENTNEHQLNICRVLYDSVESSYMVDADAMGYNILLMANISLKYGNSMYAPFAYAMLAVVMAGVTREISLADRFMKLSMDLTEKYSDRDLKGRIYFIAGAFIHHWMNPIKDHLPLVRMARHGLMDAGNVHWLNYVQVFCRPQNIFFNPNSLQAIIKENEDLYRFFVRSGDREVYLEQHHILNYLYRLSGAPRGFESAQEPFDEVAYAAEMQQPGNKLIRSYYYMFNTIENYAEENYVQSMEFARISASMVVDALGSLSSLHVHFYYLLSALALKDSMSFFGKLKLALPYRWNRFLLYLFARKNPSEFEPYALLVRAEEARVKNKPEAVALFDAAIEVAERGEYARIKALANELAAKYYLQAGRKQIAGHFMNKAYYLYSGWGATRKANQLATKYDEILNWMSFGFRDTETRRRESSFATTTTEVPESTVDSSSVEGGRLDYRTLIKVSQALSSAISVDVLVNRLVNNLTENAGAKRGLLFLRDAENGTTIQAESLAGSEPPKDLTETPLQERDDLALSIINRVERTGESIVLDNAAAEEPFAQDEYIRRSKVKSLLCSPILHHGKLLGIMYLENNLATGVFTPERLEILDLLTSQAAISIQNTRLIDEKLSSERMSTIGRMASGIVHDLKNPIAIIKGFADLAGNDAFDREKQKKFLEAIAAEAGRLTDMAQEILDFVKGEIKLNIAQVFLHTYMKEIQQLLIPVFQMNDIKLDFEIEFDGVVPLDRERFRRVIYNIANNARDALVAAGTSGEFKVQVRLEDDRVLFIFADNGPGIPPEIQESLFQPFVTHGKSGGTGLGMAMAQAIVTEHGGTIGFTTRAGEGTDFEIRLPIS